MPAQVSEAAYAKKPAWHRFGDVKDGFFTREEAMKSLDPTGEGVIRADITLSFVDSTGKKYELAVPNKNGLVDFDGEGIPRFQSIVDVDYGLVQRDEFFRFLDEVIGMVDGAHWDAAVNLRNGAQQVITAYLGDYVLDPNGIADRGKRFLWGFNSFNGSWALRLKKGDFRIECANMAAMALRGSSDSNVIGSDWSTRHTSNVMSRVEIAKDALQMWNRHDLLFQSQAEHMIQTPINDDVVDRLVNDLYTMLNPKTNQMETNREAAETVMMTYQIGGSTKKLHDTVWGAFNSVTEYEDWLVKVRGGKNSSVNERRLENQLRDPDGRKQAAWDVFWNYAEESRKFKMPDLSLV
jgi:hypothetical protein